MFISFKISCRLGEEDARIIGCIRYLQVYKWAVQVIVLTILNEINIFCSCISKKKTEELAQLDRASASGAEGCVFKSRIPQKYGRLNKKREAFQFFLMASFFFLIILRCYYSCLMTKERPVKSLAIHGHGYELELRSDSLWQSGLQPES